MVKLTQPYVPGYLAFREVDHLLDALARQREVKPSVTPQVVFVDGNGVLHPQGFGLASHLGVLGDTVTVWLGGWGWGGAVVRWGRSGAESWAEVVCRVAARALARSLGRRCFMQIGVGKHLHLVDGLDKKVCVWVLAARPAPSERGAGQSSRCPYPRVKDRAERELVEAEQWFPLVGDSGAEW